METFSIWAASPNVALTEFRVHWIVICLLHVKESGLDLRSISVHLVVVLMFHLCIDGKTVFIHPIMTRILKGLVMFFSTFQRPISFLGFESSVICTYRPSLWDVTVVLILHLTAKVTALVAITCARSGEWELNASVTGPPYSFLQRHSSSQRCCLVSILISLSTYQFSSWNHIHTRISRYIEPQVALFHIELVVKQVIHNLFFSSCNLIIVKSKLLSAGRMIRKGVLWGWWKGSSLLQANCF